MYRYRYINKFCQFGRTSCTLILEDLEDDMPLVRIEKEFPLELSHIDSEFLYQDASKEIKAATIAYREQEEAVSEEPLIEDEAEIE